MKSGWTIMVMIIVWLLVLISYIFGPKAEAAPAELTYKETHAIKMTAAKINITKVLAQDCLTELLILKIAGARCKRYRTTAAELSMWSSLVNRIKPNQRYWFIANNNEWYKAFDQLDALNVIERQIDGYTKK